MEISTVPIKLNSPTDYQRTRFYRQFYVKNEIFSGKPPLFFLFYCGSVLRETDTKMSVLDFLASKNETGWWFYEMNLVSCSTSNLAAVGALFDTFQLYFSKWRVCQLASLPSQTKPSGQKPSRTTWKLPSQASHFAA